MIDEGLKVCPALLLVYIIYRGCIFLNNSGLKCLLQKGSQ